MPRTSEKVRYPDQYPTGWHQALREAMVKPGEWVVAGEVQSGTTIRRLRTFAKSLEWYSHRLPPQLAAGLKGLHLQCRERGHYVEFRLVRPSAMSWLPAIDRALGQN